MGKRYDKIIQLNQMDFLVEFEITDNPTLFATRIGRERNWLGMNLIADVHIGTMSNLKGVSQEHKEAHRIISETSRASAMASSPDEAKWVKIWKGILPSRKRKMLC